MEADRVGSAEITLKMHEEFSDVFTGSECFKGTFSLQVNKDVNPYQVPPRSIAYALKRPIQERIRKTKISNTSSNRCGQNG